MAKILDGKLLAKKIKLELKQEILDLKQQTGKVPHLINVMVGSDHGSCAYANSQKRTAEEIGIHYEMLNLSDKVSQDEFNQLILSLSEKQDVNGIMIHKPIPKQLDYQIAANFLDMAKDLEGINVVNIGKMLLGETKIIPCTPAAVMEHLKSTNVPLRGKEVVIIGASEIVGKPLSLLLLREYATVSVCHIATSEAGRLQEHIKRAEVLIVAVGKAHLIDGSFIKEDAIVIDVGINQKDNKMVGDVEFDSAQKKAAFITPVPGGVGPVTVVMLMRNGVEAFKAQLLDPKEKNLFL